MNIRTYVAIGLAAVLVGMAPVSFADDVINACVNSEGKMRVVGNVAECKINEAPLSWAAGGEPGPAGTPGPQGEPGLKASLGEAGETGPDGPPGTSFVVIDASGEEIGHLSVNFGPWLFILTEGGYNLTVNTRDGEVVQWGIFFEELECQGQAFAQLYPGWLGRSGSDLYYAPYDPSSHGLHTVKSGRSGIDGDCSNYDSPGSLSVMEVFLNDPFITGFERLQVDAPYALPLSVIKR